LGEAGDDFSYGRVGGLIVELGFDEGGQGSELSGPGFFSRQEAVGNLLYSVCCWWFGRCRGGGQAGEGGWAIGGEIRDLNAQHRTSNIEP
jgi:hypothetical protein